MKLLLLTFLIATSSLLNTFAEANVSISKEYEVYRIFAIGDKPADIGLLRLSDKERISTKVGQVVDGITITGVQEIGKEKFVTGSKGNKEFIFALKRPDGVPFKEGPLLRSYNNQWITESGSLTPRGKKTIINNLRQVAAAGQQYILEEGTKSAKYEVLVGEYFRNIPTVAGESYKDLVVSESGGDIAIKTVFGDQVNFKY